MTNKPKLALTFEAAGDPAPAEPILKALREAGVKATFFLDGGWAEKHPDLVRRIAADGHELGNHGYSHPDWTELTEREIQEDLGRTEDLVMRLTGRQVKPWARPPYGAIDPRVLQALTDGGYYAVYRDAVDGGHWPGETNPESIYQRTLQSAGDGAVIVFHTNRPETVEILPRLLGDLTKMGFALGTLSDLGQIPSPRLAHHPDFVRLEVSPGYIRPRKPGPWQSLNLLDMGALANRPANSSERIGQIGTTSLSLVTGDGAISLDWETATEDIFVFVLAGSLRCDFTDQSGQDLGYLIARQGDFFRCPESMRFRLGPDAQPGRRWIALLWRRSGEGLT